MEAGLHAVVDQLLGLRVSEQNLEIIPPHEIESFSSLLPKLAISSEADAHHLLESINPLIREQLYSVSRARQSELGSYYVREALRAKQSVMKDFDWSVRVILGSDAAAKINEQRLMISFTTIDSSNRLGRQFH